MANKIHTTHPCTLPLDSVADVFQTGETPKRGDGERGVVLSPYQNLLRYYERLQSAYGWTMQEIDSHEIAFLLDQLVVTALCEQQESARFIDDVM